MFVWSRFCLRMSCFCFSFLGRGVRSHRGPRSSFAQPPRSFADISNIVLQGDFRPDCSLAVRYLIDWIPNGTCRGCSVTITSCRRFVWCSTTCARRTWNAFAKAHRWTSARKAALRRGKRRCVVCSTGEHLEVNHRVPLVGRGYGLSCAHHPENLEILCHTHHVEVTREQRRLRALVIPKDPRDSKSLRSVAVLPAVVPRKRRVKVRRSRRHRGMIAT